VTTPSAYILASSTNPRCIIPPYIVAPHFVAHPYYPYHMGHAMLLFASTSLHFNSSFDLGLASSYCHRPEYMATYVRMHCGAMRPSRRNSYLFRAPLRNEPVSMSIHPVSHIPYPVSPIWYPASCISHPASPSSHPHPHPYLCLLSVSASDFWLL